MNVTEWMYVCHKISKNKQKEWHRATKTFTSPWLSSERSSLKTCRFLSAISRSRSSFFVSTRKRYLKLIKIQKFNTLLFLIKNRHNNNNLLPHFLSTNNYSISSYLLFLLILLLKKENDGFILLQTSRTNDVKLARKITPTTKYENFKK
jgi:hypothetical protein